MGKGFWRSFICCYCRCCGCGNIVFCCNFVFLAAPDQTWCSYSSSSLTRSPLRGVGGKNHPHSLSMGMLHFIQPTETPPIMRVGKPYFFTFFRKHEGFSSLWSFGIASFCIVLHHPDGRLPSTPSFQLALLLVSGKKLWKSSVFWRPQEHHWGVAEFGARRP